MRSPAVRRHPRRRDVPNPPLRSVHHHIPVRDTGRFPLLVSLHGRPSRRGDSRGPNPRLPQVWLAFPSSQRRFSS